jgi:peptidoglycan/xylan/chitin deacetylase (PgdA/CDA1 family)
MSRLLKEFFGILLWLTGISWMIRCIYARRKVTIIVYHDPKPDRFDEHLNFLKERYSIISFSSFAAAQLSKTYDSLPDRSLVITLDDGHRGNYDLLPVLEKHKVKPLIYLCSQVVGTNRVFWWTCPQTKQLGEKSLKELPDKERLLRLHQEGYAPRDEFSSESRSAMSIAELGKIAPFVEFGAHTRFHPVLPRCDYESAAQEISRSKVELSNLLGVEIIDFAYPEGAFTNREAEMARNSNFRTARSTRIGWNSPGTDAMALRALPAPDNASVWWLCAHLTGIPGYISRLFSWKHKSKISTLPTAANSAT